MTTFYLNSHWKIGYTWENVTFLVWHWRHVNDHCLFALAFTLSFCKKHTFHVMKFPLCFRMQFFLSSSFCMCVNERDLYVYLFISPSLIFSKRRCLFFTIDLPSSSLNRITDNRIPAYLNRILRNRCFSYWINVILPRLKRILLTNRSR